MVELERFNGRRAAVLENTALRVAVLEGGGHIASILDKASGVSPLWIPPWPSIEPSAYDPATHGHYGSSVEARLLSSIMGHNLCLDVFGGPSEAEVAAGQSVHGEASIATYAFEGSRTDLTMRADFPIAQLQFERQLELVDRTIRVREVVENVSSSDRPIAWTQHVTLGPPFLERGRTEFRASATRSVVFEGPFGVGDYLRPGAEFLLAACAASQRWRGQHASACGCQLLQRLHLAPDGPRAGGRLLRRVLTPRAARLRVCVEDD